MRVISLVPSLTETARAWGVDPIACTKYCEQPDLPTVGGTKNPDIEAITALAPDVVLLDKVENRREDADALEAAGIEIFVTDVRTLDDVVPDLDRLAQLFDLPSQTTDWPTFAATTPVASCFVPIWRRPWMTIGPDTFGATLLDVLGFCNVYEHADEDYPEVQLADVIELQPDLVLAPSEPYVFTPEHIDELAVVAPVLRIDGQDLFWWGSRTPQAVDRLGALLRAHQKTNPG
jgi:ABC-type Fe3+-hydroxamate transport system substrate-binding protein